MYKGKSYDKLPLNQGLVLDLPLWSALESGASVLDRTRYHNNGVVTGATWGSQGRSFDSAHDDFISVPNSPSLDLTVAQGFTIITVVRRGELGVTHRLCGKGRQSDSGKGYIFGIQTNSPRLTKNGIAAINAPTFTITDTTTFHFLGCTVNSTGVTFHLDAASETVVTTNELISAAGYGFSLGRGFDDANSLNLYGVLGEVLIYSRALTLAEIGALFNQRRGFYGI
jgi:hypothetical protein